MKQLFKKIITRIMLIEARLVLKKYKPKVIAITGSVGKTSTKDAIYTALSQFYFIRKSTKSFNSELGVPLTILGCKNGWSNPVIWLRNILEGIVLILLPNIYPQWLVLEVGIGKPGDMELITSWLRPDIVVLTRLSKVPAHVEYFDSPEAVKEEKGKLVKSVKPDGILILNADDEDVLSFKGSTPARTILFSAKSDSAAEGVHRSVADLVASHYAITYEERSEVGGGKSGVAGGAKRKSTIRVPTGITFRLDYDGKSVPVTIHGSLGQQYIYTTLAALSVGLSQGLNLVELVGALADHNTPPGRMRLLPGIKNSVLIDDTYNSSPVALASALDTLGSIDNEKKKEVDVDDSASEPGSTAPHASKKTGRKIAVLGDMLELGKYATDEHRVAGVKVAEIADVLVTVGLRARFFAESAQEKGMKEKNIFKFEDSRQAATHVQDMIKKGDVVLIKGSQSMRMERVTEALMAEPEKKADLLVRQDEDWINR